MLKQDKNGFLNILVEMNYDPSQFEVFEESRGELPSFVIRFKNTPMEFWVRNSEESFFQYDRAYVTFSPTFTTVDYSPGWTENIEGIYNDFKNWLQEHVEPFKEEQKVPDLWSQLEDEQRIFGTISLEDDDFRHFSVSEKQMLLAAISQFRSRIMFEYSPSNVQLQEIDKKLVYLTEAVDRLNKFDWKSLLLSTIIGIATTMSLDSNSGRALFSLAKQVFSCAMQFLK